MAEKGRKVDVALHAPRRDPLFLDVSCCCRLRCKHCAISGFRLYALGPSHFSFARDPRQALRFHTNAGRGTSASQPAAQGCRKSGGPFIRALPIRLLPKWITPICPVLHSVGCAFPTTPGRSGYLRVEWMSVVPSLCPVHHTALEDHCGSCRHKHLPAARRTGYGFQVVCPGCERPLAALSEQSCSTSSVGDSDHARFRVRSERRIAGPSQHALSRLINGINNFVRIVEDLLGLITRPTQMPGRLFVHLLRSTKFPAVRKIYYQSKSSSVARRHRCREPDPVRPAATRFPDGKETDPHILLGFAGKSNPAAIPPDFGRVPAKVNSIREMGDLKSDSSFCNTSNQILTARRQLQPAER